MDKLLAKYFQVFQYIGLVTGHWSLVRPNPGFEARMLEGRWECRGVEFCRFYVFTQEMSLECYKWLVKREPVGDTVFSTLQNTRRRAHKYIHNLSILVFGAPSILVNIQ